MKTRKYGLASLTLAAAVSLSAVMLSTSAVAQDKIQDQTKDQISDQDKLQTQDRTRDMIYGSQLMTLTERNQYRDQMRTLETAQEREAFRLKHHEQMQERARAAGVKLPNTPPAAGMGPAGSVGGGAGAAGGKGGSKK